jgi:hypothetical protein
MAETYRIADEPRPSAISHLTVRPVWPLLGSMLGGVWLSWPWFALNGYAMGSPTWKKELLLIAGAFAGTVCLSIAFMLGLTLSRIPESAGPYFMLCITVWKLSFSYALYSVQSRTFGIYEHFGGPVKNGLIVVALAAFLLRRPMLELVQNAGALWVVVFFQ